MAFLNDADGYNQPIDLSVNKKKPCNRTEKPIPALKLINSNNVIASSYNKQRRFKTISENAWNTNANDHDLRDQNPILKFKSHIQKIRGELQMTTNIIPAGQHNCIFCNKHSKFKDRKSDISNKIPSNTHSQYFNYDHSRNFTSTTNIMNMFPVQGARPETIDKIRHHLNKKGVL